MKSFQNVINEILDTSTALGSASVSSEKTPNVVATNDDFYARGDARIPNGLAKKKRKKKVLKRESASTFSTEKDKRIRQMNPELKFQFTDSIDLVTSNKLFDVKNEIVNGVIEKTRNWVRIQSRIKLKRNPFDVDFKEVIKGIQPYIGSSKTLYVGTYIENKRIKFIWYVK